MTLIAHKMSFFVWHQKVKLLPPKCTELNSVQEYVTNVTVSFFDRNLQPIITLNLFREMNLLTKSLLTF